MQCKKISLFLLASIVNALFTGVQGVSLNKISKEFFLDNNILKYIKKNVIILYGHFKKIL